MDNKIENYIKNQLSSGSKKEDIKKNLQEDGWNEEQIGKVFKNIQESSAERNDSEREISDTGKLEVKYYNIAQPIIGLILVLGGIITTYILFQDHGLKDSQAYLGILLIAGGVSAILLWNRTFSLFDRDRNKFSHKIKSLFKEDIKEHELTEVKNVIYSEKVRVRRSKGETNQSINRIAEVEVENGVRYLLHKSTSSSRVGLFKNKTKKKAEEVANFVGVDIKNESLSPANMVGKIMDKFGRNN